MLERRFADTGVFCRAGFGSGFFLTPDSNLDAVSTSRSDPDPVSTSRSDPDPVYFCRYNSDLTPCHVISR